VENAGAEGWRRGFRQIPERRTFPKGYIWKTTAKKIAAEDRTLLANAVVFEGRVENIRSGGQYGEIALSNISGERFVVKFNPRYWTRAHRRGDFVKFAITTCRWVFGLKI
jgi:hypothetical protein